MTVRAIIFTLATRHPILLARINTRLGYPKAPTAYVGCSAAALPPGFGTTVDHTYHLKHPTLSRWAVVVDPAVEAQLVQLAIDSGFALPAPETLTSDWFPPP